MATQKALASERQRGQELSTQGQAQREQLKALEAQLKTLEDQLQTCVHERDEAQAQTGRLSQDVAALQDESKKQQEELVQRDVEMSKMAADHKMAMDASVSEAQRLVRQWESEAAYAKKNYEQVQHELETAQAALAALEDEKVALIGKVTDAEAKINETRSALRAEEEQREKVARELRACQQERDAGLDQLEYHKQDMATQALIQQSEKQSAKAAQDELKRSLADAEQEIAQLKTTCSNGCVSYILMNACIQNYCCEYTHACNACTHREAYAETLQIDLRRRDTERMTLKDEIDRLHQQMRTDATAVEAEKRKLQEESAAVGRQLQVVQGEKEGLSVALNDCERELHAKQAEVEAASVAAAKMEQRQADTDKERAAAQQQCQDLQQQLENERSKSENEKASLKQAALSKMEATIEQHTSEIRTLESQVYSHRD